MRRARLAAAAALNSAAISWAELEAHLVIASMSIASKVSEGRLMLSGLERPDSPPSDGSEARGAPSSPSNSWTSAETRELELRPFARFAHNSADEPRREARVPCGL